MRIAASLSTALAMLLAAASLPAQAQVTAREARGNLESRHALGCIRLDDARNAYTPADLMPASSACARENQFVRAADLYMLAYAYARFDVARVTDRSAHQAFPVLRMQAYSRLPEADSQKIATEMNATMKDTARHGRFCAALRRLGPPAYQPRYMLQHGMGAFLSGDGTSRALAENFDAQSAWQEVLTTDLKCSRS